MVSAYVLLEGLGIFGAFLIWLKTLSQTAEARVEANFRLQVWWVNSLFQMVRRLYRLRVEVEGSEFVPPSPFLLLVRHVSIGDTLLPTVFVSKAKDVRLRFILKQELLYDPCLDVVGQRIPNCFVRRGSEDSEAEIARVGALAMGLGPRDAVLLYPEGTRFSAARRTQIIERRKAAGDESGAAAAQALEYVLPPRTGGFLALTEASPPLDVLVLAHEGFDRVRRLSDLWNGSLLGTTLRLSFRRFAASELPATREERRVWLFDRWRELDAWVGRQAAH